MKGTHYFVLGRCHLGLKKSITHTKAIDGFFWQVTIGSLMRIFLIFNAVTGLLVSLADLYLQSWPVAASFVIPGFITGDRLLHRELVCVCNLPSGRLIFVGYS